MDTTAFISSAATRLNLNVDFVTACVRSACGGQLPETITETQVRDARDEILDGTDGNFRPEPIQCPGCGQHRTLIRGRRVCTECV